MSEHHKQAQRRHSSTTTDSDVVDFATLSDNNKHVLHQSQVGRLFRPSVQAGSKTIFDAESSGQLKIKKKKLKKKKRVPIHKLHQQQPLIVQSPSVSAATRRLHTEPEPEPEPEFESNSDDEAEADSESESEPASNGNHHRHHHHHKSHRGNKETALAITNDSPRRKASPSSLHTLLNAVTTLQMLVNDDARRSSASPADRMRTRTNPNRSSASVASVHLLFYRILWIKTSVRPQLQGVLR